MQILDPDLVRRIRDIGVCAWCLRSGPVEASHTFTKGIGGGQQLDHPLNLVPLCRIDHQLHEDGHEPKLSALVVIAALREGVAPQDAWEELYRLRR